MIENIMVILVCGYIPIFADLVKNNQNWIPYYLVWCKNNKCHNFLPPGQ